MGNTERFRRARDLLLDLGHDHDAAYAEFRWPEFTEFNWALDWFDAIAADNHRTALHVVSGDTGERLSYVELSRRSSVVANGLRALGVERGDALLVMLDNQVAVWETMIAAIKLGAVVIPTFTTVSAADLRDRVTRADVRHLVTTSDLARSLDLPPHVTRIAVGEPVPGWRSYADLDGADEFVPDGPTRADDPLFLYFTSGTTSRPKLVRHTHVSYPVGHLSGMYWNGVRPGDVHLNVSAPGWAKHAWSSFFVPFNAEATLLSASAADPVELLDHLVAYEVTTFCAPPTVWRMLIQHDLRRWSVRLREAGSVGEPLNPEVVDRVRAAWGLTVRDGYGQTETTAQIGNSPASRVKPGSMGKPLPGYEIVLVDPHTGQVGDEGEICVALDPVRPVGVMTGYVDDDEKNARTFADNRYHTGDIGRRDEDGHLHYVGRTDDVFKSYDHRISPFELESVLLAHEAVAEAAVVPAPDPVGLVVPKAFVALAAGFEPSEETARRILDHTRENLAPHQWIRRLEFAGLPKTTSGKIRRAELRTRTGGVEYLADLPAGAAPGIG
ncbi:AMP-binding protein [Saccharothrix violaceirubra]|uniref:Acetyl-CoA synthetase n=1 Tax=Saccharothrix violaceirubra TaxID=413306 RepID=A0A7W7TA93_9PSEU|nr:AMP-binding protein [Saccharothrix violaceirubra]MBB4969413.1 acetyl-CoA synthetase [Saccharothrix violaceirubra]